MSEEYSLSNLKYRYPAVRTYQTKSSKPLIQFSAPASEIMKWAGVPQKKLIGENESETVGFQRVNNVKRIEELKEFYRNESNVVQNGLICSPREIEECYVDFIPLETEDDPYSNIGHVEISFPDFYNKSLLELMTIFSKYLKRRIGDDNLKVPLELVNKIKKKILEDDPSLSFPDDVDTDYDENLDEELNDDDASTLLFEETYLIDFWREVEARRIVLEEIGDECQEILGFEKKSILSFILPVTLVDGQHRLLGALSLASEIVNTEMQDEIVFRQENGENAEDVQNDILKIISRKLPISLLEDNSPQEQVFQFVTINQKAQPLNKPLLGTIISTTLSNEELNTVSERLTDAGIQVEEARVITWISKDPSSPFYSMVQRGVSESNSDLLKWSVLGGLVKIFKELKGGALYHEPGSDYAREWKEYFLEDSALVSEYEENGFDSKFDYWSSYKGPWSVLFIKFFSLIKTQFSNTSDVLANNYWGKTRQSNLFNKISLTILSADFFNYLVSTGNTLNSIDELDTIFEQWLSRTDRGYFSKDWRLSGVKKDSTGIRAKWAYEWLKYRISPAEKLPNVSVYRSPKKI